jgi:hypothetical protein
LHATEGLDDLYLLCVLATVDSYLSIHGDMANCTSRHAEDNIRQQLVGHASCNGRIGKIHCEKIGWCAGL